MKKNLILSLKTEVVIDVEGTPTKHIFERDKIWVNSDKKEYLEKALQECVKVHADEVAERLISFLTPREGEPQVLVRFLDKFSEN